MGRKRQKSNNISGKRLSDWINELNTINSDPDKRRKAITQSDIARAFGVKQQTISKICQGEQTLTPELARFVSKNYPKRFIDPGSEIHITQNVNPEFLLGIDGVPKYLTGEIVTKTSLDCLETLSEKYIPLEMLSTALGKTEELIMCHGYRIASYTTINDDGSEEKTTEMIRITSLEGEQINISDGEYSDLLMNLYNSIKKELLFLFYLKKDRGMILPRSVS